MLGPREYGEDLGNATGAEGPAICTFLRNLRLSSTRRRTSPVFTPLPACIRFPNPKISEMVFFSILVPRPQSVRNETDHVRLLF